MSIIRKSKMKEMSSEQMAEQLKELRLELSRERATSEIGASMKSPGRVREIRKTIAKMIFRKNQMEKVKR